jgi:hypothetical protein
MVTAGPSDRGDALINKQSFNVRFTLATVATYKLNPARVIDEALKWLADLYTVVEFESGCLGVVSALRVAKPLADFKGWKVVEREIEIVDQSRLNSLLQYEVATEIEQEVVHGGWFALLCQS